MSSRRTYTPLTTEIVNGNEWLVRPATFRQLVRDRIRQLEELYRLTVKVERARAKNEPSPSVEDATTKTVQDVTPALLKSWKKRVLTDLNTLCKYYDTSCSRKKKRNTSTKKSKGFTYPVMMTDDGALTSYFLDKISAKIPSEKKVLDGLKHARSGYVCHNTTTTLQALYTRLYPEVMGWTLPDGTKKESYLVLERDPGLSEVFLSVLARAEENGVADPNGVPVTKAFQFTTYQSVLTQIMIRHTTSAEELPDEYKEIPAKLNPETNKELADGILAEYEQLHRILDVVKEQQKDSAKTGDKRKVKKAVKVVSSSGAPVVAAAAAASSTA